VEWSENKMQISTTAGSQTKDIGPNGAYMKYQDIRTTFEPAAEALKMTIFYLGSLKQLLDRRWCNKKPSTLFVLMKKHFWLLENRCTGSFER
jgi:hypothetical protein